MKRELKCRRCGAPAVCRTATDAKEAIRKGRSACIVEPGADVYCGPCHDMIRR